MKRAFESIENNIKKIKKSNEYAIVNLLMISDDYLIGCITLAQSIRQFKKSKKVDLICMVTPDISKDAINELSNFYDRVISIEYIEIASSKIKHSQESVKNIYAKAFSKINCLQFTEYKKVLMMDVDMLVVNKRFFRIFKVNTPAAPYIGCLVFYKKDILEIYKKEYSELKHGSRVPNKYYNINPNELYQKYNIKNMAPIGIESTIFLVEPNLDDLNSLKTIVKSGLGYYKSEANLLHEYYKYKLHHIDMKYVGRWENPDINPKIYVMDLYGFYGKPWQTNKINELIKYDDTKYWIKKYKEYYEYKFKDTCLVKEIHELYNYLQNNISV